MIDSQASTAARGSSRLWSDAAVLASSRPSRDPDDEVITMNMYWMVQGPIMAIALCAAVTDTRSGVIPNWLTLPALGLARSSSSTETNA